MPGHERQTFVPVLTDAEMQEGEVSIPDLLDRAIRTLDGRDTPVDAVIGFWDFPISTLVPLLAARYNLHGASLESVVKCEHKYWSRVEQQRVTDAHPRFGLVDLDDPRLPDGLRYPMWLKPVKSYSSELAFHVSDDRQFADAVAEIRDGIGRLGRPFEWILDQLDLPPEIAEVGGQACLAEEAMTGARAATEGYVHDGEVVVYGVLDSITYPGRSSFLRHQYPSQLPEPVRKRLVELSERVIERVGLNWTTFSVEFFCDPDSGDVSLLEINPRHSQSHAQLFADVDGIANHHAMVELALGRAPDLPHGEGPYEIAAKWYHRRFEDGVLRRGPSPEEVARIEREIPGVRVTPVAREGQRLSELLGQDSYSFELTDVIVGARDEAELRAKYERAVSALTYEFT
ncbi:ATP-grasp domain-containing protein [Pseudonocardia sp. DSM 110487]|uniref:ATP-grasp domain-containing protein n=1 Tax=Pseudonocardia sp. DSM 110487 TaxID=2865833 RepID=UPI001C69953C|nr:ATP-grasp domain-containing protein [Pseudonocardia sp. DSM 110487]QYN40543.1 ATP-grasp domain-containing protein [Pseudonocardia sp. DSM 110487]